MRFMFFLYKDDSLAFRFRNLLHDLVQIGRFFKEVNRSFFYSLNTLSQQSRGRSA